MVTYLLLVTSLKSRLKYEREGFILQRFKELQAMAISEIAYLCTYFCVSEVETSVFLVAKWLFDA
jgi:hypothetical protein